MGIAKILVPIWGAMCLGHCKSIDPVQESKDRDNSSVNLIKFKTEEFTDPHVDVSPDGKTLLFDVLGNLYTVSIHGGTAKQLTAGSYWDIKARYSPDGKKIAFVSDRSGKIGLWTLDLLTNELQQQAVDRPLGWMHIRPFWTPNGDLLDFDNGGLKRIIAVHKKAPVTNIDEGRRVYYSGAWSKDNRNVYYLKNNAVYRTGPTDGKTSKIWEEPDKKPPNLRLNGIMQADISPNNRYFSYYAVYYDSLTRREFCFLKVFDLHHRALVAEIDSMPTDLRPNYAFTADSQKIILGRKGRLQYMELLSGKLGTIPVTVPVEKEITPVLKSVPKKLADTGNLVTKVIRWPTYDKKNGLLVYSAFGKLYCTDMKQNRTKRLTDNTTSFEYAPALSPNGSMIAYTTWNDSEMGHVMMVSSEGGSPIQVTQNAGRYTNPTWSSDGKEIAFIVDGTEAKYGIESQHTGPNFTGYRLSLAIASIEIGKIGKCVELTPMGTLPARFYPVPEWSRNGQRIFVNTYSRLHSRPVLLSVDRPEMDTVEQLLLPLADEVRVGPGGNQIAIIKDNKLWAVPWPKNTGLGKPVSIDLSKYVPITENMPVYVTWSDNETLLWAETNKILEYNIKNERPPKTLYRLRVGEPMDTPKGIYALTNVRIITMQNNRVIENGTIVVENNRIRQVGPKSEVQIPKNSMVYALKGKTVIPGLIDVHAHYHNHFSELWSGQNKNYIGNLAFGVTTIYDPSSNNLNGFGQSEMEKIGAILAPRILSSGKPIEGKGFDSYIENFDDALNIVGGYAQYDSGPVKEYLQPYRQQQKWLQIAAKRLKTTITSHFTGNGLIYNGLTRVADGYTAIEHQLRNGRTYGDIHKFIAKSGVNYTPTLTATPGLGNRYVKDIADKEPKLDRFNPFFIIEREKYKWEKGLMPNLKEYVDKSLMWNASAIKNIIGQNGLVSVGAHGNGFPGLNTHWELWSFTLDGLSNYNALKCATVNGAKKIGLDQELGSISPGKLADLVLLNSNPLTDIRNSSDIYWVVKNGKIFDAEDMKQYWPDLKELLPWSWRKLDIDEVP